MTRILKICLLLCLGLPLSLYAGQFSGQITDIEVGKTAQNELEVIIEGTYGSYQAHSEQSPASFVIEFDDVQLRKGVSDSIEVKGNVISSIKAYQQDNRSFVVLASASKTGLFHSTIQDKGGRLVVKCWMPEEAPASSARNSEPAVKTAQAANAPKKELKDLFGWPDQVEKSQEEMEGEDGTKKISVYTGEKITLDFFKTDIHNVFRLFAEISKKNIIVDDQVSGELTLSLKEVPWDFAMAIILELKNLITVEKLNTMIVKPAPEKVEEEGKGELVVHKYSEEILHPAKVKKQKKEKRRLAQEIILKAHNLEVQGRKKEALALYERAYDIWKDNADLIKKTTYLHYALGNYAKSYYYAGKSLQLNKKDAQAALYAALSATRMDKNEEARQLFDVAINADPDIPEIPYNYGLFLERQEDFAGALHVYQNHERRFGPSLDVSLAIAALQEGQGKTHEACKKYREIRFSGFAMDTNTESMVMNKAQTLCSRGEN